MTWALLALALALLPDQALMDAIPKGPYGLNVQNVLFALFIVALIEPFAWPPDPRRREWPRIGRIFALYLALAFLATWYGFLITPMVGPPLATEDFRIESWRDEATCALAFVVAARCVRSESQMKKVLVVLLVASAYFIHYYLVRYYPEVERIRLLPMPPGVREAEWADSQKWMIKKMGGVFTTLNSNGMAAYYLYVAVFFTGLCWHWRSVVFRLLVATLIVFLGMGIFYSLSRGALVAAAAAIGYGIFHRRKWLVRVAAVGFVAIPILAGRLESLDGSAATRLDLWNHAVKLGLRYPMGVGYRLFHLHHRLKYGLKLDTHNFFLRSWAELGPLGAILVIALVLACIRLGWLLHVRGRTDFARGMGRGCSMMWVAIFVANLFGDRLSQVNLGIVAWTITGMTMSLLIMDEKCRLSELPVAAEAGGVPVFARFGPVPEPVLAASSLPDPHEDSKAGTEAPG
ncbi:MAG: O-antigen ligase family protein [Deltaproteobacteria bacterium]|nr:O-antigen ligase family protein [Deltaproteobacteria bacterium]